VILRRRMNMDNFKIIYKILRGLEKNMGNENFKIESISATKMKISFEKLEQLLILMQVEIYIKGLVLSKDLEQLYRHISEPIKPQITIKGLEYLAENSFMAKAKNALKMVGEII
jgi:hypothetical protein